MTKYQIWELTIPQLNYFLRKVNKHIEFTVKVSSMSMGGLFGGATGESENTSTDDFKIANSEDIDFLGSIL